jgi:hypothetical protein
MNEIMKERKSEPAERVLCKDIARGKEPIPIQVRRGQIDQGPMLRFWPKK